MREIPLVYLLCLGEGVVAAVIVSLLLLFKGVISKLSKVDPLSQLAFSKAAFFYPEARVAGVEYTWIRYDRQAEKTAVRRLSGQGHLDQKTVSDPDGEWAYGYADQLDLKQWTRISSGPVGVEIWESYHQRSKS